MPKHFIDMACDSKLRTMIIWCVMSVKLNITKKIAGLEKNDIKLWKNIACLQTYRTDV